MKNNFFLLLSIFLFPIFTIAQPYGTGLNFDDDNYDKVPKKASLTRSLYSDLPQKASLKKYAPTPKSQGSYGTCVGWSTAYCALAIVDAIKNGRTDKTEITNHSFSPGFVYNQIKSSKDVNCKFGVSIDNALYIICTKGAAKYDDMEEKNCPSYIPANVFKKAEKNKLEDYARLFNRNDSYDVKVETTKKSISENKPVVIGMKMPDSFYKAAGVWKPTEDHSKKYGGHAMTVVGYDDDKYGGAFEIQNSWGTRWGNNGYIWIKYDDYADFVKYGFELIEPLNVSMNVNAELSGSVRFITSDGDEMTGYYSNNIYKMKKSYRSGTRFRIYISNNEAAYVYAFGTDATNETFQLFPHNESVSPILNYKQNDVPIPDENHFIEMDNTTGTDYLCVLYSAKPLDISNIQNKVKRHTGNFTQKIKYAIGEDLIQFEDVYYSTSNKMSFKAKTKGKSVVALIVETQHID